MKSPLTDETTSRAGPRARKRWRLSAALVAIAAVVAALVIGAGTSEAMGGWGSSGRKGSHHRIHRPRAAAKAYRWWQYNHEHGHWWDDPAGADADGTDGSQSADDGTDGVGSDDQGTDGTPTDATGDTTPDGASGGTDVTSPTLPQPTVPVDTSSGDPTAMPGELPGWRQVFADDFNGNTLNTNIWEPYYGQPGGDPGGWWEPSHVVVHDGILDLQTYRDPRNGNRWVSGGVSSAPAIHLTYGKVLVRFRVDAGYGISSILLLYGHNRWPPEIDFAEHGGEETGRSYMANFLHYGEDNRQIPGVVTGDFTQWHTMGVEWTPGKVVYTLDGQVTGTVEGDMVPAEPMNFDMQAQAGTCGSQWNPCPNETTPPQVNLQVDWATVYTMA